MKLMFIGLGLLGMVSCSTPPKGAAPINSPPSSHAILNLIQYAKPMCGTGTTRGVAAGANDTFPGATAPFGMIQWSPDTEAGLHMGGYSDLDSRISGFSVDHISGAGCGYGEDFQFMPMLNLEPKPPGASRTAYAATFSHTNEAAKPGYYAVTFDNGIKTELTASARSGFGRFTYPTNGQAALVINAASCINGSAAAAIHVYPATREITGSSIGGHFCRSHESRVIYFYAIFDHPFANYATWSDETLTKGGTNGAGTHAGAFVNFDTSRNRTILAKVGISYVSIANAKNNVESENPLSAFASTDFDRAVNLAGRTWNLWLNQIQVSGGTPDGLVIFYSMLYHALIAPSVVSDSNGQYMGYDGQVHAAAAGRSQYGFFSGWDVYRSECQLLGMLAPKESSDMAQSLLMDYQQGGAFPRWGVATEDSGVMMGDPAAPMISGFYAFGATNFDAAAALAGLVRAATDPSVKAPRTSTNERDALDDYLKLGYVPERQTGGGGSVSITLEYAASDFSLALLAKALGDETDCGLLMQHAQNWRHLFNPQTGYLQMRRRDGSWAPYFASNLRRYDGEEAYVEGTAGQYLWMVPFDLDSLAGMLGGPEATAKRLDEFFTKLNVGDQSAYAWMGNEPCLATPWIYCFIGRPYQTQSVVRRVLTGLYSSQNTAYPGNDDLGEMSSWYIFAALGMYPEIPGSDIMVLNGPLFPKAVLHLQNGDVTITGNHAGKDAPYIQSLAVNGQPWNKPWMRFSELSSGGKLAYDLGTLPNPGWGDATPAAPPSGDSLIMHK
jgi:predicted alpha-1,2-mannosidase